VFAYFSSFKVRLALLFGCAALVVVLPSYFYLDTVYTRQLVTDKTQALRAQANAVAAILSESLQERQRDIRLLAEETHLNQGAIDPTQLKRVLDHLKQAYPLYAWLGYADTSGKVLASASGLLAGADVSARPWFIEGKKGQYVGDLHEALLLAKHLPPPADGRAIRFIDFAAPVKNQKGELLGVLAAHAHWDWSDYIVSKLKSSQITTREIEIYLINKSGAVIYPDAPGKAIALPLAALQEGSLVNTWDDQRRYASAYAAITEPLPGSALGWKVVVRQPEDSILADVNALKRTLVTVLLIGTLILMAIIGWLAARLSRPVEQLSIFAKHIEEGKEDTDLVVDAQSTEVRQAIASVRKIAKTLIDRKQALEEANRGLEQKVAERTAELEDHKAHLEDLVLARTRELAATKDIAVTANEAKNNLLANMSHELRTPLNHIIGMNSLLKREVTSAKGLERITTISQSSQRLLRLINNLLDTVHAEAAQIQIQGYDFDVAELIGKVRETNATALNDKKFALEESTSADVPLRLHGDIERLAQVLSELVDNAIKFSEEGPVILRTSIRANEGSYQVVRFEVEDKGLGIPPEIQADMFNLFVQGDGSSTRKYGGVGLGLQLCKRLTDLMAGEIGFTQQPGKGSLFWLEVPLTAGQPKPAETSHMPAQQWSEVEPHVHKLIAQLEEGDFSAQQTWSELSGRVGHLLGDELSLFESSINNYDFDVALPVLSKAVKANQ